MRLRSPKVKTPRRVRTGPSPSADLMSAVELRLLRRSILTGEIAAIDAELREVFYRLAQDVPACVPPAPTPAEAAEPPVGGPKVRPSDRDGWPRLEEDLGRIVALVRARGPMLAREVYAAMSDRPRGAIKVAAARAVARKLLERTGQTTNMRYHAVAVTAASAPAPVPPRRPVTGDDGAELETVWTPHRDAPSLIGERTQRASTY